MQNQPATEMRFVRSFLWEFVQNLPLVASFVLAFQLWQEQRWVVALVCMAIGGVAGSLLIRVTESKILLNPYREPLRVTVMNSLVMPAFMFILIVYLSEAWSDWRTDLLIGGLLGIVLGAAQNLAAGESVGIRHCVALACSFSLTLVSIRMVNLASFPFWVAVVIATFVVTLVISFLDYTDLLV